MMSVIGPVIPLSDIYPYGQFRSPPRTIPPADAVKAKLWKLALLHTPDPNRLTTRRPDRTDPWGG